MTLQEFLQNPAGPGDTALNMTAIKQVLDSKYEKLISDPNKKIKLTIYKVLNRETYYFLMTIPTETDRGNSYDVVIQFIGNKDTIGSSSIGGYDCKFFSNSPAFGYTHAKVYKDNGLLVSCLMNKFDKEMLTMKPKVRNRYGIVGYDKYLYFGAKYLNELRIFNRVELHVKSIRFAESLFTSKVRSIEVIMKEYRTAERKLRNKSKDNIKNKQPKVRAASGGGTSPKNDTSHNITKVNKNAHKVTKRRSKKKI